MLTIFFLIAISIFLPFFWFVALGYTLYLFATKKQRRDKVIMTEVMQSIDLKREQVILDYLCFDSAKSFAVEHSAILSTSPIDDTWVVVLNISGEDYQIMLRRWGQNDTQLLVCTVAQAREKQKRLSDKARLLLQNSA